jgi:hypothetical protein
MVVSDTTPLNYLILTETVHATWHFVIHTRWNLMS